MRIFYGCLVSLVILFCSCNLPTSSSDKQKTEGLPVQFMKLESENKVDVLIGGKLFTSYFWADSVHKPILFPILTAAGTAVTRGYPLSPRDGERPDHYHQVGMWLNYGNVNGFDFWGNGAEGERKVALGDIKHEGIEYVIGGNGQGSMAVNAGWIDSSGKKLLSEKTIFYFSVDGDTRIIDRVTSLTALADTVYFKDTKEGSLGIRVARQLEMPSNEESVLVDAQGNVTTVKAMSNVGVTGDYKSSEGIKGADVWGTRARWMNLFGSIGKEKISLVICDHPSNLSYPTYWHARGYGLFAANPFGAKDFTKGKIELNYSIAPKHSLVLRYRVIISSGQHLSDDAINTYADEFAKKY